MAAVSPLIVITGPTASGKSALAMELATKWGGEIVCADSRTVYRGMDVGTAKPTKNEQTSVRHWALDVVDPGERFTVVDFQRIAQRAIEDIRSRGKTPFLVGGTGLYIDAVVLSYVFGPEVDSKYRAELEKLTTEQLLLLHNKQRIELPENHKNRRYLIRNIEKYNTTTSRNSYPDSNTFVFAIEAPKSILMNRIKRRIDMMFEENIVLETQQLLMKYGAKGEAMTGNVYKIVVQMLRGEIEEQEAKVLCVTRDWQLAKRQTTWIRRHDFVKRLSVDEARRNIETILQKHRDA